MALNFPDLLTGEPSPAGTGLNVYRDGVRVFAATLSHQSLNAVLPVLQRLAESHAHCDSPSGDPPPECWCPCVHRSGNHYRCLQCGKVFPVPCSSTST